MMVKAPKTMKYEHRSNLKSKCHEETETYFLFDTDVDYKERKILVVQAEYQSSGKADPHLIVPGYIVQSRKRKKNGLIVSVVEPITEEAEKTEIREKIEKDKRFKGQISFWQL